MLQTISPDLLPFITTVINGSLTSGHVPTVFKKARVIPILKKPTLDPSDISNYRRVSLLSFLSKILERVVCNQLSDYLMQNNLHDPNQSGFKAAHSTETALLAVTEKLHAARSAKLSSVLILLDLSAAFDTVNHNTLLSTLRSLGICGTAWEWFASYLDGRSYQVTWKGLTSAPRRLSTGVPQGSVLGPLLFSLYTHSLGKVISSHGFSYHCYADDNQLIFSFPPSDTTASARISACLADISSWMTAHQLKLNPSKTELLIIPGDPSPAQDLTIFLSNSMISPSAIARNLGVTMDNQLSFSSHVTNVTRSCRFLLYNIRRIRPFLSTQATQLSVSNVCALEMAAPQKFVLQVYIATDIAVKSVEEFKPRLDVGHSSKERCRLTIRRKEHKGPMQCVLGSSHGRGPQRPRTWTKNLAFGTWNVTSLGGKEPELVREVERYQLEIVGPASMHSLGSGTQLLERGWTLFSSGVPHGERRWAGMGLLIAPQLSHHVLEFSPVNERVVSLCARAGDRCLTVISAYGPNGSVEYPTFLETLRGVLEGAPTGDSIVLLGDFNAHVGNDSDTWRGVIGRNGPLI
ncbi:hypothetical protein QTP86_006753 [Hemibagrus guttatus]|nr:hypothetical protein QTP86_006753 [Hemibagrus guttatus]